ncbi:MAG: alpha-1,2-fucosyltransferase [Nitrospira sp.]|nr:alpha-1,2-fucosyltransferase [Nitrospira sp.]
MYLNGGLGNIMFQVAFIESLGKKHNIDVGYSNVRENINNNHRMRRMLNVDLFDIFKNINFSKWGHHFEIIPVDHIFSDVKVKDHCLYQGFAVSEKNFLSRDFILWLFEPSENTYKKVQDNDVRYKTTCSIHVRRSDYVNNPGYAQLNSVYYQRAIDEIKADRYLVFSDDIDYCKEIFEGDEFVFCDVPEDIALFLMAVCTHNIIANSTFSWWSAYLNRNPEKKIIAPKEWVGDGRCKTEDIVPKEWRLISNV